MGLASCGHGPCEYEAWPCETALTIQWRPEGDQHYSQSVVDLFEFIQQSLGVILHDLPLSPYKRALYLTDMSKVSPCLSYSSLC